MSDHAAVGAGSLQSQAAADKRVLWIDDREEERLAGRAMLEGLGGITSLTASSSDEAADILGNQQVDAIVTDILRRLPDRSVSNDDGYRFIRDYVRPQFPALPVIFHTKNLPTTFATDDYSQYLSKWEAPAKKAVELEVRLSDAVALYEAFADSSTWSRIEPRLVKVNSQLLAHLRSVDDVWRLSPDQFEQIVSELLEKLGFNVLWVPGGKDGGIDIVAGTDSRDYLIDVKRYHGEHPVSVELVRAIYGVSEAVAPTRPNRIIHGGIITSSRFTSEVDTFRRSLRKRPLLRDGEWLRAELARYAPRIRL